MILTYNDFDISAVGDVTMSIRREFIGGSETVAPQRARVTLEVSVDTYEDSFANNASLMKELRVALATQHGVLVWQNDESGEEYVNQTATVSGIDLPDSWGEYTQEAKFSFTFFEELTTQNVPLTLAMTATAGVLQSLRTVVLGNVTGWRDELGEDLVSPARQHRRLPALKTQLRGSLYADPALALADRRAALLATHAELIGGLTAGAEATLTFGGLTRACEVESFTADVDQHTERIDWALSAVTPLYDKTTYALADWSVSERDALEPSGTTGETALVFSGKVQAATDAQARALLSTLRVAVNANHGYQTSQTTRAEVTPSSVTTIRDGETFLELSFTLEWRKARADNVTSTFTRTGLAPVNLGHVTHFTHAYSARRFNENRSQRQAAGGRVTLRGVIYAANSGTSAAVTAGVAGRRTLLLNKVDSLIKAVNGADGKLVHGNALGRPLDLGQAVRVEEFTAEVNQHNTGIEWSMTAGYSMFPDEAGYATVEFTVAASAATEDGDEGITFAGRIMANSEAAARAKLDSVRASVLVTAGFTAASLLRDTATASSVFANGDKTAGTGAIVAHQSADGTTFIELSFSEEYRRRKTAAIAVSTTLRISDADDVKSGFLLTTYAGTVTASGANRDAAYTAAAAKAAALGGGKYPFIVRSQITWDQRQTRTDNVEEFVRLEFSYEYQRKGTRTYMEMSSEAGRATFGLDGERVSGFISAPTVGDAAAFYQANVKALFNAALIREERTGSSDQTLSGVVPAQFVRYEFALALFTPKAVAATVRYALEVDRDYLTLEQVSTVSGTCFAADAGAALATVNGLLGALAPALGKLTRERSGEPHERVSNTAGQDYFLQYDFSASYVKKIDGIAGILSCEVTEEVEFSSIRWVVQPLPRLAGGTGGISIPQDCGIEPGRRRISGSCVAATEATATAWANTQRSLLTGDADLGHYETAASRNTQFVFVPRTDGVPRGGAFNAQVIRLQFGFGEILPNYPYPGAAPAQFTPAAAQAASRQGYVQSLTTGLWHKQLAKTTEDGVVVEYLDQTGVA